MASAALCSPAAKPLKNMLAFLPKFLILEKNPRFSDFFFATWPLVLVVAVLYWAVPALAVVVMANDGMLDSINTDNSKKEKDLSVLDFMLKKWFVNVNEYRAKYTNHT